MLSKYSRENLSLEWFSLHLPGTKIFEMSPPKPTYFKLAVRKEHRGWSTIWASRELLLWIQQPRGPQGTRLIFHPVSESELEAKDKPGIGGHSLESKPGLGRGFCSASVFYTFSSGTHAETSISYSTRAVLGKGNTQVASMDSSFALPLQADLARRDPERQRDSKNVRNEVEYFFCHSYIYLEFSKQSYI